MRDMNSKDLLYKILDYECRWTLPQNQFSKPAKTRLDQIEQLLDVFGLAKKYVNPMVDPYYEIYTKKRSEYLTGITNLQYVQSGEFIKDRPDGANKEVLEKAVEVIRLKYPAAPDEYLYRQDGGMEYLFSELIKFRKKVYKLTYPWHGLRSGFSTSAFYNDHLQQQLKDTITNNLTEIDNTLCLILDPAKREFSNDEINFVEINMESMDMEWWLSKHG